MKIYQKGQSQQAQQSEIQNESNVGWIGRKISNTIPHLAKNLNRVALPLIVLVGLASITEADAGPSAYVACCALCGPVATVGVGGMIPMAVTTCLKACLPLLYTPGP